jgi:sigma-B regulation protein RsbU (phosphoserine phosphatase)
VALGPRATKFAYTEADIEFCSALVAQASVALDNAWHFRDTLYRRQLEKELEVAANIQRDLFPKALPKLAGTRMAARNRQAREVGGDYYDVLGLAGSARHLACVADISGKGISASLLMANIQATLRALLASFDTLPSLAARANDLLWASTPGNRYATALFVLYDPATGACEYTNCGHCEAILLRAGGAVELLTTTGMPIGLFPARTYESGRFQLAEGDVLMLYSDGVTDACATDGRDFGMERAIECLRGAAGLDPEQMATRMFEAIDEFAAGAPQFDDITLMILARDAMDA